MRPMPDVTEEKAAIRSRLRKARREFAESLPDAMRALVFNRPPAAVLDLVPAGGQKSNTLIIVIIVAVIALVAAVALVMMFKGK